MAYKNKQNFILLQSISPLLTGGDEEEDESLFYSTPSTFNSYTNSPPHPLPQGERVITFIIWVYCLMTGVMLML